MEKWEEFNTGKLVSFVNEGDFIIGEYIGKEANKGKFNTTYYTFKDIKTKEIKGFFGSAVIDRLFATAENQGKLKENTIFKLIYTGKIKSKNGKTLKNFKLYFKK